MNVPLSPYVPENLVSRDGFSRPIPRQLAHLHTQAGSGAYSRDSSRVPRRRPVLYLNRHTPLGQSRVYRVTQLRTNGVHCRESAGTGPLVLKVVSSSNRCCHFAGHHGSMNVRLSFPTPTSLLVYSVVVQKERDVPMYIPRHIRQTFMPKILIINILQLA